MELRNMFSRIVCDLTKTFSFDENNLAIDMQVATEKIGNIP